MNDSRVRKSNGAGAGASARRQGESMRARREREIRAQHPYIGGLLARVQGSPLEEKRWERGAVGEEKVAKILDTRLRQPALVLHDRRIPGSRANIDHIVIAPSGVWVVDTKRYRGKAEIDHQRFGGTKLMINGRDQTKLVDGLARQVETVRAQTQSFAAAAPVWGVLCFVDTQLPILRQLRFGDFFLLRPQSLVRKINAKGAVTDAHVQAITRRVAYYFPPA